MKCLVVFVGLVASTLACGGALTGESGTFASPNYPSDYGNNAQCTWTITVPAGERVRLTFSAFDVEDSSSGCYDSVTVTDRSTVNEELCGSSLPAQIVAASNVLIVTFTSDSSVGAPGFQATYGVDDGSAPPATTAAPGSGSCGGSYTSPTGSFTSPNYPGAYDNNLDCTWTITIPEGIVLLKFKAFSLEASSTCSYDYLRITDGSSNTVLGTRCGTSTASLQAESNSVTLRLVTDSSVASTGFEIEWGRLSCGDAGGECLASNAECDGTLLNGYFCANGGSCCRPRFEQSPDCGILPPSPSLIGGSPRIVGGNEAGRHSWPWQASLQTTDSSFHFCGGSVIADRWIVTAAHCVDGDTPSGLKVVTGDHRLGSSSAGAEEEHAVERIIMHENYDGNGAGFPNDIALLKLQAPISFNSQRHPICLAEVDDAFVGDNCFITGWGRTQGTGDEDVLNELEANVRTQAECERLWGTTYVNAGHICLNNGLTGACNGDSGGPLACEKVRDGVSRWVLAGATSWGRSGCQTEGYPSVYSRISYFRNWLEDTIRSN